VALQPIADSLRRLCAVPAPSGYEDPLLDFLAQQWGVADRHTSGRNLLFQVGGHGVRTLVHAHADQVGYVVLSIEANGHLLLDTAQGKRGSVPEIRWPVGQAARVATRGGSWIDGIFAASSAHIVLADDDASRLTWKNFWLDVGFESRDEALASDIHIGAPVIFAPNFRRLGKHRIADCAMDDRVGLCVMDWLYSAVRSDELGVELWFGVTVQEETGMHGAAALARGSDFDQVIGLEVGLAGDLPNIDRDEIPWSLGAGPMLVHKDYGVTYDRVLTAELHETARRRGIPIQDAAFAQYASDSERFIDAGSPSALLAVPTRYTHTGFEVVDLRDVEATADLLQAFVRGPAPKCERA
jgi:putative aminopeptidase FrvX